MSSTNRGRDRVVHDYYVTPVPAIEHFLRHFLKHEPGALDGVVLDPCAGGAIGQVEMSYPEAIRNLGIEPQKLVTMDIRLDSLAKIKTDYLNTTIMAAVDCVITNPPFGLAIETINRSLDIVNRRVGDHAAAVELLRGAEAPGVLAGEHAHLRICPQRAHVVHRGRQDGLHRVHARLLESGKPT